MTLKKEKNVHIIAIASSIAIISIIFSPLNTNAATFARKKGINLFGSADGFDVKASWFFGAHPGGNQTETDEISLANPRVELQSSFKPDKHGSTGAGSVVFNTIGLGQVNEDKIIFVSTAATAGVMPKCPENPDPKCGKISLLTIADGNIIFKVSGNENNNLNEPILPNQPILSIDSILENGTTLSLGNKGSFSDSIILNESSTTLYNIEYEVVLEDDPAESGDPLIKDQKIVAQLTTGSNDSLLSLVFDSDITTIEDKLINAFEYDPINDLWKINQDTSIFSVSAFAQQNISAFAQQNISDFILNSSDQIEDKGIETVPEPITGLVIAAGLGGAALKRAKDKLKKS